MKAYVADFGLSKIVKNTFTSGGDGMTLLWAAPEQREVYNALPWHSHAYCMRMPYPRCCPRLYLVHVHHSHQALNVGGWAQHAPSSAHSMHMRLQSAQGLQR